MKRLLALFLLIGFVCWIMPLGYFIKPSQEKTVCDGQRAMCMCSVMMGHKAVDKAMAGISLKAASANKENSSSAGNYFVSVKSVQALNLPSASLFENQSLAYKNPFLASLEYVPKI